MKDILKYNVFVLYKNNKYIFEMLALPKMFLQITHKVWYDEWPTLLIARYLFIYLSLGIAMLLVDV